jgi:hypothetical protein
MAALDYDICCEDVDYILDAFPIVKRKDEQAHGEYRTKRVILEIYDEMKRAMESGAVYQTRLDPLPANGWTPPEIKGDEETGESGEGEKERWYTEKSFGLSRMTNEIDLLRRLRNSIRRREKAVSPNTTDW